MIAEILSRMLAALLLTGAGVPAIGATGVSGAAPPATARVTSTHTPLPRPVPPAKVYTRFGEVRIVRRLHLWSDNHQSGGPEMDFVRGEVGGKLLRFDFRDRDSLDGGRWDDE